MIKNYINIVFRNLWRNKAFSAINVLGLSIGISASLVIFLIVHFEFGYDTFERDNNLIAVPVAWWAVYKWLEDFAYRTAMSWWIFLLSGAGMLCTALITVSVQTIRAATANPARVYGLND